MDWKHAEQHTRAYRIERLFSSLPSILINLAVMPVVTGIVMWGSVPKHLLLLWIALAFVVLAARYALAVAYARARPAPELATRWGRWFTATSLFSGVIWGAAGWAFFVPESASLQVFLYVCLVGLAAGSIIVTSYWLPAYYAFAVPSVGLSATRLFVESQPEYIGLGLLMLMYLVIITRVAQIQARSAMQVALLRDENVDLVAQLRTEKAAVEQANDDLDRRVRERTTELEVEVEERRRAEERLDHLAHHDPLTGLPNRRAVMQQLERSIISAARRKSRLGVLFIDLDRFKEVNDSIGHTLGDKLLVAVVQRVAPHLRSVDTLSRLGGDEFLCVIDDLHDMHRARLVADKLIALLSQPFELSGHEVYLSASVGISLYPEDGGDGDTLVRNADTALYRAKGLGGARCHFYTAEMTALAQERVVTDVALRRAIGAGELHLHYQIKIGANGLPCGVEALVRWRSAEFGQVPPSRFIPLAEDTGFIVPLGEWVLREACAQMMRWHIEGLAVPSMSVNLSVRQIDHGDVVARVSGILEETGLSPKFLELEITESAILNVDRALPVLEGLNALGVGIAVDDFGTGYSSLSYLKRMPVQTLKIDRSFVSGVGEGPSDEAIIRAVISLARSLGFSTVAEGVETPEQRAFLLAEGVDALQGYLLGRPCSAADFAAAWRAAMLDEAPTPAQ